MKIRNVAGGLVVAAVLVSVGTPSYASETEPALPPEAIVTPMTVAGYDEAVAEAHGFEIVTHADGSVESVPVTPEAISVSQAAENVQARGEVHGNCGSSFVYADRSGRMVTAQHGYIVAMPVWNRVGWSVSFATAYGVTTVYTPDGPSPAFWQESSGTILPIATTGTAIASGDVIQIDGTICVSGNPSSDF